MKNFNVVFIVAISLLVCFACSDPVEEESIGQLKGGELGADKNSDTKMVTKPFDIRFVGNYDLIAPDVSKCGEQWINIINNGQGTGTHLGSFTHHFDFCVDYESYYPGDYMKAWFVAANGDSLFVYVSGRVIDGRMNDHPDFVVSYFRDPFVILDGTGRFKGATGGGLTDDYNSINDPYSHHHWVGTISMVRGKKE